ncbi:hypothetical protein PQX77_013824 [Marasmius sp. AFHP31]|nr:hypothetical protein PQX77_013824 [Marasmius sp. AFHP31]
MSEAVNPSVNFDFLRKAVRRFSTSREAVDQLKELGVPPARLDGSSPDTRLDAVVDIFGALAAIMRGFHGEREANVAAEDVKANWVSTISPWTKLVLEDIVLNKEGPTTPEGIELLDNFLLAIPAFLILPGKDHGRNHAIVIKRQSPYLQPLLTQAWLRVIDTGHRTWGIWSSALVGLSACVLGDAKKPKTIGDGPYKEDVELGLMLIRHLNNISARIPTMTSAELDDSKLFLLSIGEETFAGEPPFTYKELHGYSIQAVVRFLDAVLCKQKGLRKARDNEKTRLLLDMAVISCTAYLDQLLKGSDSVGDCLKSDILKVIFKAYPEFYTFQESRRESGDRLYYRFMKILNVISRFLIYPSVLHEFVSAAKSISIQLEEKLEVHSKAVWLCWVQAKAKAYAIRDLRRELRRDVPICGHRECPKNRGTQEEISPGRYFHWPNHRAKCSPYLLEQPEKRPLITQREFRFFHRWVFLYIEKHGERITQMVNEFVSSFKVNHHNDKSLPKDGRLVRDGNKNPIVVIDFNRPDIPKPEQGVRIISPHSLLDQLPGIDARLPSIWAASFISKWRHQGHNTSTIAVVAFFPPSVETQIPWPIENVDMPFPLRSRAAGQESEGSVPQFVHLKKPDSIVD